MEVQSLQFSPSHPRLLLALIPLSGPVLDREALGWFVDMSAIGASIGYFFTYAAAIVTERKAKDGTAGLRILAIAGVAFSVTFIILQLVPIPTLQGVHFGKESYLMLVVWIIIGVGFYLRQKKKYLE